MLGANFETQGVNAAQLSSLVSLVAWAVEFFGVGVETIAGYRDYAATLCPGQAMYAKLTNGDLQRLVNEQIGAGGVDLGYLRGEAALARVAPSKQARTRPRGQWTLRTEPCSLRSSRSKSTRPVVRVGGQREFLVELDTVAVEVASPPVFAALPFDGSVLHLHAVMAQRLERCFKVADPQIYDETSFFGRCQGPLGLVDGEHRVLPDRRGGEVPCPEHEVVGLAIRVLLELDT